MNVVATRTTIVATESGENEKKNVATQKLMLRHNNELKANISVVTKGDYVVTIKAVESEISVATEKYSVSTENRREVR